MYFSDSVISKNCLQFFHKMDLNHEDDDSDDEGGSENTATKQSVKEQEVKQSINENISQEVKMMPPLLPLKFGNGLLLQYTVNTPGRDDKLGLMEVGLGVGVTSLALVLLSAVASYMLKSVPLLVEMEDRKRKTVARLLRMFDIAVGVLQVVLLLVLFIFTVFYYNTAEFTHAESEYYVTKRIYMFSFVISCVMFLSIVVTICIVGFLYFRTPSTTNTPCHLPEIPPASSLLPLGLANTLLGLYIAIPGDDNGVLGSRVFLLDLCLVTGSITIFLTVLQSIGKIALLVSLRDGVLDTEESKIVRLVHLSRYLLAGVQFLMYLVMFSHCMEILAVREHRIEYLCPRNLLSICILLSSSAMLAGLVAISMGIYVVI